MKGWGYNGVSHAILGLDDISETIAAALFFF